MRGSKLVGAICGLRSEKREGRGGRTLLFFRGQRLPREGKICKTLLRGDKPMSSYTHPYHDCFDGIHIVARRLDQEKRPRAHPREHHRGVGSCAHLQYFRSLTVGIVPDHVTGVRPVLPHVSTDGFSEPTAWTPRFDDAIRHHGCCCREPRESSSVVALRGRAVPPRPSFHWVRADSQAYLSEFAPFTCAKSQSPSWMLGA